MSTEDENKKPLKIKKGEKVTVEFAGQSVSTVAQDGRWSVHLKPLKASAEGRTLQVRGNNTVVLTDGTAEVRIAARLDAGVAPGTVYVQFPAPLAVTVVSMVPLLSRSSPTMAFASARPASVVPLLALIVGACVLFDRATPFPGRNALVPCLGCALVIHANAIRPTLVGHLLSFTGTDTIPAIDYAEDYYGADADKELPHSSAGRGGSATLLPCGLRNMRHKPR